jgi:hypothetical protein
MSDEPISIEAVFAQIKPSLDEITSWISEFPGIPARRISAFWRARSKRRPNPTESQLGRFDLMLVVVVSLVIGSGEPATAMRYYDVPQLELGCRVVAGEGTKATNNVEMLEAGFCSGLVAALMETGSHLETELRICVPLGVPIRQGARAFLRFVDTHPERRRESALDLMMVALRDAWPCDH